MKKIYAKDNQLVFSSEVDESLANAIRRYISKIPLLAIDAVEISKNDSPLYDETVAQRIGLIPLKMPSGSVKEDKEFTLKLSTEKEGFIKAGELKGDLKVVYEGIPITFLNKGQEFEIVATAKVGRGIQHAKFNPGLMFYRNTAEITLDKEFANEIKGVFPKAEIKEKGNKIIIQDNQKADMIDFCEGIAQKNGAEIEIKYNPELIITLEGFGQMDVDDIFKKAVEELGKDLEQLEKKISKE
ncbi:DNA-directed RNA polymerase subunit D [uncultured archaeon]|nr:DNA-directed RNA polymerase subunit D [uncultured archaeon]